MNYRHGFHAGNFADVFKHALLVRLLLYLRRKETPFRVIDTHAGEGAYDLASDEAERTGEWRAGVGRLADVSALPREAQELLQPYLDCLGARDPEGRPTLYPGSPLIAQRLMRNQDRALFCELRPDAYASLRWRFARDERIKTIHLDGYLGLGGFVPPKERRGLVLIDPPFERVDEFDVLQYALRKAYRMWSGGIYVLWHPSKVIDDVSEFKAKIDMPAALSLSLSLGGEGPGLRATGMVVINPPYVFADEARVLLAGLCARLGRGVGAEYGVDWLTPPR